MPPGLGSYVRAAQLLSLYGAKPRGPRLGLGSVCLRGPLILARGGRLSNLCIGIPTELGQATTVPTAGTKRF